MTGQVADVAVADEAAVDAVLTASRTLIAVATSSLGAAAEETTIAQYRALVVLASRGPQRMTDLAGALDVTPSTAGRMCDRLVRKGLIRRHRARADRRAVQVSITPGGAAGRGSGDRPAAGTARRYPAPAARAPAAGGGRRAACVRRGGRGDAGQPVAAWIRLRCRRRGRPGGKRAAASAGGGHDGHGRVRRDGRDGAVGRADGWLAARLAGGPVRHCGAGRRGVRAGCGGVPVPDLLLHLAGDRSRPVRPGGLRGQCASAVARAGVLRGDPGHRRHHLRPADLPVRPRGPRPRRA